MSVPITVSPGRDGFTPELSLSYDSGSGNGPFGLGWTLSLPSIARKTDKGLPRYQDADESDVFVMSGAEDLVPSLVEKDDGSWETDARPDRTIDGTTYRIRCYRRRTEGAFARIERWTNEGTGAMHWRTISRNNVTTLFGFTEESRVADPDDPTRIYRWLVSDRFDDRGNAMHFSYAPEDSTGVDTSRVHERNRTDASRSANRYVKRIHYGNRTPRQPGEDLGARTDWMFEVVFDYGEGYYHVRSTESDSEAIVEVDHQPTGRWAVRQDPFSSYRAGFEIRTYRLCRRMLLFHHFEDELGAPDYLVRSTEFEYEEDGVASTLSSVIQCGYSRRDDGSYLRKSVPPIELEYSKVSLSDDVREVDRESLANIPSGLGGGDSRWVDLDGEGVSGILIEQDEAWYFKRNLSPAAQPSEEEGSGRPARFAPLEVVDWIPSSEDLGSGSHRLLDLAGDGRVDLVRLAPSHSGYFERTRDEHWDPYVPFAAVPNISWQDPNLRFLDLTGDGHADVLITEDDVCAWYPSLGEEGYSQAQTVHKALDEETGPNLVFADGTQSVYVADLSGDGLKDLARIRNGEVCYWPNMGYGQFGSKVTMDDAPWFDVPDQFDQRRVQLADIDGSGTTDIIYIGRDGVRIYANESGNRWGEPQTIDNLPQVDNPSDVTVVDLLGNGTACLVWSSPLPTHEGRAMRYVDLMGGQKPHLLTKIVNNLGAETRVHYAPSTKFYVKDRQEGRPWITRLPFPVHVVERVDVIDHISRNRFTTHYAYHHGYFDGAEREFRGFGMVEQWDTESMAALAGDDVLPEAANVDAASHVPPVYTKMWFHTGAYRVGHRISNYFAGLADASDLGEYYREPGLDDADAQKMLLPDTVLPQGLTADEEREACRSLKGSKLREEVYALDGSDREQHPYSVTEKNFTVRPLQPKDGNRHAAFFTHARESLNVLYERDPSDPRITHNLTLEVDDYGHVLKSATVGYGRRSDATDEVLDATDRLKQRLIHIFSKEHTFTNAIDEPDTYHVPKAASSRTYEVRKPEQDRSPDGLTELFGFDEMAALLAQAADGIHDVAFEDVDFDRAREAAENDPAEQERYFRRHVEEVRTLYRKDDLTGPLPLGDLESMALPFESYKLAFTPGLVDATYGTLVDAGVLEKEGGYVHFAGDDNWWMPSGRSFYTPDAQHGPAGELAFARQHFFLPHRFSDPFGQTTTIGYDDHDLSAIKKTDPLGSTTAAELSYRTLRPAIVTGPNGNRSAAAFDALGMVVGTAVMGKAAPAAPEGDSLDGFEEDLSGSEIRAQLERPLDDPHAVLGTATSRMIYDLYAYARTQENSDPKPPVVYTLTRETHAAELQPNEKTAVGHSFSYSDGFGREIQQKIQAEPEHRGDAAAIRWVCSGWTVFNNKGRAVRQYEPFFTDSHTFQFAPKEGVSPVRFYDPVGRVIAVLHPNDTYEKVVFDAWQQAAWDVNDTVLEDPRVDDDVKGYMESYFAARSSDSTSTPWRTWHEQRKGGALGADEQAAAAKASAHASTPKLTHLDALGRTFITIAHNKVEAAGHELDGSENMVCTRVDLDINGNQRSVRDAVEQQGDPRGRIVMQYDYDILERRIRSQSMDSGERRMLDDVEGNTIRTWDSRGHAQRIEYDALHRRVRSFVAGFDESDPGKEVLTELLIYGWQHPQAAAANLHGMLYLHLDQAGAVATDEYDFKGNPLRAVRRLASEYKSVVGWDAVDTAVPDSDPFDVASLEASLAPSLENEAFITESSYDALSRPTLLTWPDGSVIRPGYNEANLLEQVDVRVRGAVNDGQPEWSPFITNIDYDAKGQRRWIEYGNGVTTSYRYDPLTYRLLRLHTKRDSAEFPDDCPSPPPSGWPGCEIQDLHYTYDPAGNITHVRDDAQQTIFFRNKRVDPSSEYTYDALYQLVEATGREHLGQNRAPIAYSHDDAGRTRRLSAAANGHLDPHDGTAMGTYAERYVYDAVGNLLKMQHRRTDANQPGWTRTYEYNEASLIEPAKQSNRLSQTAVSNGVAAAEPYTHDAHGNMTSMPHLPLMQWSYRDRLRATSRQVVQNGGTPETTYYVYDASGQRIRKVTERPAGAGQTPTKKAERIYLGGFEIYREYASGGAAIELERETLHVMDEEQRIALIETRTEGQDPAPEQLIRYQIGNHLGSCSLELDGSARIVSYEEYTPFGSTSYRAMREGVEAPKRFGYTDKERDEENGLHYFGARYYASWLGRWTRPDPAGLADGTNVFGYVRNNPVRLVDPSGRQSNDDDDIQWVVPEHVETVEEFKEWAEEEGIEYSGTPTVEWKEGKVIFWLETDGGDGEGSISGEAPAESREERQGQSSGESPETSLPEFDRSLEVGPGLVWSAYTDAIREANNESNPMWARGTLWGLATLAAPLAFAEEFIGRPIANVPHMASMSGQYAARASLQKNMLDKASDYSKSVGMFAFAFVTVGSIFAGGAGGPKKLGGSSGAGKAGSAGSKSSASIKDRMKDWLMKGSEYDEYFFNLSTKDKHYYMKGQKTFSKRFYNRHAEKLESFTKGKTGEAYVQGIVERGKWLKKNHPIRSSDLNVVDFAMGIKETIKTGPDPATRRMIMKMFRME